MGKNKSLGKHSLGRTLLKEKRQSRGTLGDKEQWHHTSDIQDGYDWGRLNLTSVTEQTDINEFLATAELADTEFLAEKGNLQIVTSKNIPGVLSEAQLKDVKETQSKNIRFLTVPRRPPWNKETSPEELKKMEKESFLNWRRELALLHESDSKLLLTPYEKNLDVWRQLWRVIERSDVVCQIVDARNPLLYRCEDLDRYISEVSSKKLVLLLVNKSDLLTEIQRRYWSDYFTSVGVRAIFWSALAESDEDAKVNEEQQVCMKDDENEYTTNESEEGIGVPNTLAYFKDDEEELKEESMQEGLVVQRKTEIGDSRPLNALKNVSATLDVLNLNSDEKMTKDDANDCDINASLQSSESSKIQNSLNGIKSHTKDQLNDASSKSISENGCHSYSNRTQLYTKQELINLFKMLKQLHFSEDRSFITVGLVGYPNVGKSSTINSLLQAKKTSVSATPGKTKHFQTLFLDEEICLCDCPGLVFPHFVPSKAEMILAGILPIDEMRDCIPPVTMLCSYIPRKILEITYGVNIPLPAEDEDPDRDPTAYELLSTYANMRGFMSSHGLPDIARASRYILKDFVKGRLLYCTPPPNVDAHNFKPYQLSADHKQRDVSKNQQVNLTKTGKIDKEFFSQQNRRVVMKTPTGAGSPQMHEAFGVGKPWKKHFNKNKKEKLRRLHKP